METEETPQRNPPYVDIEKYVILKTTFMQVIPLSPHQHLVSKANEPLKNLAHLADKLAVMTQDSEAHEIHQPTSLPTGLLRTI